MLSSKIQRPIVRLVFYSLLCFVFVAPVLRLCVMSFHGADGYSLANFITLFHDQRTWEAIKNTLIISIASTIMAAFVGSFLAFVSAYTNIRHKKLLELLVLMPFIIPSYIVTLSWSGLLLKQGHINTFVTSLGLAPLDLYSLTGIWVVLGFINIPVVYLSVVHMLRKIPAEMEWASRACGFTIWQTIWRIDLREVWPAIASGSLLAFLAAIDNFAVPAFLGISLGFPYSVRTSTKRPSVSDPMHFPWQPRCLSCCRVSPLAGHCWKAALSIAAAPWNPSKKISSPASS